jgi:8-oxo-dGTP diphosphatase
MKYTYDYPRPAVTVDAAIFRRSGENWEILLIKRGREPFLGMWALPGGFVEMDETLEEAVERELEEETGLTGIVLQQLHTFSKVNRDPRHRTISTVFWGLLNEKSIKLEAGDDASALGWFGINDLPEMAFDHKDVMKLANEKLGA